eukprot:768190-Hanusia_phi.AAC.2
MEKCRAHRWDQNRLLRASDGTWPELGCLERQLLSFGRELHEFHPWFRIGVTVDSPPSLSDVGEELLRNQGASLLTWTNDFAVERLSAVFSSQKQQVIRQAQNAKQSAVR